MVIFRPATPEVQRAIDKELNQDEKQTQEDLRSLRQWLNQQPHLPKHIDDQRLERFLYGCKFSLERTKSVLDTYYRVRATCPEFFTNRDPYLPEMQRCFTDVEYVVLPNLTSRGYRVTIFRLTSPNINKFNLPVIAKRVVMALDVRLCEERCLSNVMIVDLHDFTLPHYSLLSPTHPFVRKAMLSVQDAFPFRLSEVHFMNCMPVVNKVLAVFAPLLKKKLTDKFHFHTNIDTLYNFVDRKILPQEYGGDAGTFAELNDSLSRKLETYKKWFREEERISKSDESRRPRKSTLSTTSALQQNQLEGSFRRLIID